MSTHAFQVPDDRLVSDIVGGVHTAIRWPNVVEYAGTSLTLTFELDLTPAEVTTLSEVVRAAQTPLTRAERNAIEPQLVTGRAFLALSQADFIALGQNARDRMLHDNVSAQWRVVFRLLRD